MPRTKQPPFPAPVFVNLEQATTPAAAVACTLKLWDGHDLPDNAAHELRTAYVFLFNFYGSAESYNSYRKQLEKLFLWAWVVQKKSIFALNGEDMNAFTEFAFNPPGAWVADANYRKYVSEGPNPAWRPFVAKGSIYSTSRAAVASVFASIGSFYKYAVQNGDIPFNPVDSIRQKSKFAPSRQVSKIRRFENSDIEIMFQICDEKCSDDPAKWERARWSLHLLLVLYLRLSEVVETARHRPMHKDFTVDREGNYWLRVIGKGNKERRVTVPDSVIDALYRYREHLGEPPVLSANDQMPMISSIKDKYSSISSTRQMRRILDEIFVEAAEVVKKRYGDSEAAAFLEGTAHWLRHTGISEDVKYRPKEHVRDEAGHQSSSTTDRYIDVTESERTQSRKSSEWKVFK